jgi:hypothetical protein
MIFVAIAEHTAAICPGSNKEVLDIVAGAMPTIPDLEKKHGVKNLGIHVMLGSHKNIMILDAPSYEAAELLLLESKMMTWNTIELGQAYTPEQAMALTMAE